MVSSRAPGSLLLFSCVAGSAGCIARMLCCCERGGRRGGFQSQAFAIWELQEMGLGCGKFLRLVLFCFVLFLAFYLIGRLYEE